MIKKFLCNYFILNFTDFIGAPSTADNLQKQEVIEKEVPKCSFTTEQMDQLKAQV